MKQTENYDRKLGTFVLIKMDVSRTNTVILRVVFVLQLLFQACRCNASIRMRGCRSNGIIHLPFLGLVLVVWREEEFDRIGLFFVRKRTIVSSTNIAKFFASWMLLPCLGGFDWRIEARIISKGGIRARPISLLLYLVWKTERMLGKYPNHD